VVSELKLVEINGLLAQRHRLRNIDFYEHRALTAKDHRRLQEIHERLVALGVQPDRQTTPVGRGGGGSGPDRPDPPGAA
jgi:hypothetical protein